MTPERFRRLALALPDSVEGQHQGHPDFRAHGRVFASLHPDGEQAMVKVPMPLQRELCDAHGDVFTPATGAWGRAGCTMLVLGRALEATVRDALTQAWQLAASGTVRAPRSAARKATPRTTEPPAKRPPRRPPR